MRKGKKSQSRGVDQVWTPPPQARVKSGEEEPFAQTFARSGSVETKIGPAPADPIPMRLVCESCGKLHIDEGEFVAKHHHTHSCQHCGLTWRPAVVCTVGVRFLPGFKNPPDDQRQVEFTAGLIGTIAK